MKVSLPAGSDSPTRGSPRPRTGRCVVATFTGYGLALSDWRRQVDVGRVFRTRRSLRVGRHRLPCEASAELLQSFASSERAPGVVAAAQIGQCPQQSSSGFLNRVRRFDSSRGTDPVCEGDVPQGPRGQPGGLVQITQDGLLLRTHRARHDKFKEFGALGNPGGRPSKGTQNVA
jgi:hypothetical protein